MEIDQLRATSISLTFGTKASLHESDDLVSLYTPHHSFPLQHHCDGKSFSHEVTLASYIAPLRSVDILCFNKELVYLFLYRRQGSWVQLGLWKKALSIIPLTADSLLNLGSLSLASRVLRLVKFYNNHICTSKYLLYCITIMSNPNEDSFHAPNSNHNVNPRYIYFFFNNKSYIILNTSNPQLHKFIALMTYIYKMLYTMHSKRIIGYLYCAPLDMKFVQKQFVRKRLLPGIEGQVLKFVFYSL